MTYLVLPELLRRTILQGAVRMHKIVISEPAMQCISTVAASGVGLTLT